MFERIEKDSFDAKSKLLSKTGRIVWQEQMLNHDHHVDFQLWNHLRILFYGIFFLLEKFKIFHLSNLIGKSGFFLENQVFFLGNLIQMQGMRLFNDFEMNKIISFWQKSKIITEINFWKISNDSREKDYIVFNKNVDFFLFK